MTGVKAWIPDAFSPSRPAPSVGQRAVVHLQDGIITEPVTDLTYCDQSAMTHARCGA